MLLVKLYTKVLLIKTFKRRNAIKHYKTILSYERRKFYATRKNSNFIRNFWNRKIPFKNLHFSDKPDFQPLTSVTTRKPREKEMHGIDKFFYSLEEFEKKKIKGSFAQSMKYLETGMHIKNHKLSYVIVE